MRQENVKQPTLTKALGKQEESMMKMEKRMFKIGELAHHLELQQFVIRFWEKEFNFKSHRSQGGQRYYTEKDVQRFERIKEMLYTQGLTIAGAKKQLNEQETMFVSSQSTTLKVNETPAPETPAMETPITEIIVAPQSVEPASAPEQVLEPVIETARIPLRDNTALIEQLNEVKVKLQKIHGML
jgi:DNA-binding transcriptional MerR regulator